MAKKLVIVESPAKAKTIGKFLGRSYKVVASVGHVRDLPKSTLGIDIEDDFNPKYINIRGKGPLIRELKKEAKKANDIYLATDPDREGEAISWHLAYILGIDLNDKVRVEFNEITKNSIKKSIEKPRLIDQNLVDAQQARRVLDRLVGYKISPLLWKKIRKGLSAGRVQSVATKLICDRETEINEFVPKEYWSITTKYIKNNDEFEGKFIGRYDGNKESKIALNSEEDVNSVLKGLDKENFLVNDIKKGSKKRNPLPPYTTSTLQQDASKKLGFTTKKTMIIAQQLYEGIEIKKEGSVGLITYMRTDSIRLSNDSVSAAKEFIIATYGEEYSNGGRTYTNRSKKESQDAHESIRPTLDLRSPSMVKSSLDRDQFKLYKLIWDRFISSQMTTAEYETLTINVLSDDYLFRSTGSRLIFPGFLIVSTLEDGNKDIQIPEVTVGEKLNVKDIEPKQHFTQPPPRYTEASLIKLLEELGIGRPSTYSPTIGTILARDYVILDNKSFFPTELGVLVNSLLTEYFDEIINEKFTAQLEYNLDSIAEGDTKWKRVISDFYRDFAKVLDRAEDEISKIEIEDEITDEICEKCGRNMVIKTGRYGKFLACPGYPECKNTKAIVEKINVKCPKCTGEIIRKKSKRGRVFYGCTNYPDCNFVSWNEPVNEKCPKCNEYMVVIRNKKSTKISCSNKECGFSKTLEPQ